MFFPPRAYFFVGLNIVRALSIIGLLLVLASNIVTIVHDIKAVNAFIQAGRQADASDPSANSTLANAQNDDYILGSTVPNQPAGAFWAVLNRLLIVGQVLVLLLSEIQIGPISRFFDKFFPVLGDNFGLGALGIIQCLLGAAVLSHHVDDFTLVSAFFLFSVGCLNMLLGLIFRQGAKTKRSITAWKDHAKSALPTHVGPVDIRPMTESATNFVSSTFSSKKDDASSDTSSARSGMGFGRQAEKAAGLKGYILTKPLETLPRYAPKPSGM